MVVPPLDESNAELKNLPGCNTANDPPYRQCTPDEHFARRPGEANEPDRYRGGRRVQNEGAKEASKEHLLHQYPDNPMQLASPKSPHPAA